MDLDDALAELVAHSGYRLLRVAYQLTHDPAAAQDLAQDALLRVTRSMRRRDLRPQDWYAYLRRAVINEYLRTRRLRSSAEVVTDRMPERQSVSSPEDQIADRAQLWTAPHIGDLGIWTNAPYIQIHPAHAAAPAPRTTRPATTPARSSTATGFS